MLLVKVKVKVYSNLFYVDGPTGITKVVSHIEGASPWPTGLNLDQWISMRSVQDMILKVFDQTELARKMQATLNFCLIVVLLIFY